LPQPTAKTQSAQQIADTLTQIQPSNLASAENQAKHRHADNPPAQQSQTRQEARFKNRRLPGDQVSPASSPL